ncbi:hypothetical protein DPEC_G00255220 [Dallia pectoralis]|uniref:Uncharacterized protein n=1 Tax=Dallia pectoralis TaxID=75939 RepID=A0ACC2FUG1_DALPE|nr:hypothetical protein DPEC_G00255220 [Dallia pectoralis]
MMFPMTGMGDGPGGNPWGLLCFRSCRISNRKRRVISKLHRPRKACPWDTAETRDGIMFVLKVSSLLVAYVLLICQMHSSHSAPTRTGLESMTDGVTLTDFDARRLLSAIAKEFVQANSEELQQQTNEVNSPDRPMSKRCSNLSTCVLGKLSQELHKLQTNPRTNTGSGTPGKKRSLSDSERYSNYED